MLIERDRILELIPHQGRMCLLDGVERWDDDSVRCVSRSHLDPANPLRRDGRLSAIHALEYGAQAMAVHGGLLNAAAGRRPAPGLLVAARDLRLTVEHLDDIAEPLQVEARRMLADGGNLIYSFSVRVGERELASGRATVMSAGEV